MARLRGHPDSWEDPSLAWDEEEPDREPDYDREQRGLSGRECDDRAAAYFSDLSDAHGRKYT